MTAQELQALVAAAMRDAGGEPKAWDFDPGDEDHLVGPDGLAQWLAVLDDRTPGSDGPLTFDSPEFDEMLGATILLVVDYTPELDASVYELLARLVAPGCRVLVIQTAEHRWRDWRSYLSARWRKGDIAEIVPIKNAPAASDRLRFTCSCCVRAGQ